MTTTGAEAFRQLTDKRGRELLQAIVVGIAIGGGQVPDWVTLDTAEEGAVKDAILRDGKQTGHITEYLRRHGVRWDGPQAGRVIDAVCRQLESSRELLELTRRVERIDAETRCQPLDGVRRTQLSERPALVARIRELTGGLT